MIYYDPQTKTLTVAHQDFRISEVYVDDGVYCLVPKDPAEQLFITNGKRIIRAFNFTIGRDMFLRYLRSGTVHPRIFVYTPDDVATMTEAVQVFLLITSSCTDDLAKWLEDNDCINKTLTVREWLDRIVKSKAYRGDMVIKYFTEKDDFSRFTPHNDIIPGTEPVTLDNEDYV
jgi:hypothetical protein